MKPSRARSNSISIPNLAAWQVFLSSICLSLSFPLLAKDCSDVDIALTSQAQVDSFKAVYGSCDFVVGDLGIGGNTFTDLAGLNGLTGIGGSLGVQYVSALTSLSDLSGLTSVGGLYLTDSDSLNSLNGLNNLSGSIERIEIYRMDQLTDLTGMPASLDSVDELRIEDNDSLQSLTNLPAIASLRKLEITENIILADIEALAASSFFDGFESPFTVPGPPAIIINGNPLLASLTGIPPVTTLTKVVDDVDDGFPGPNDQHPDPPPDFLPQGFELVLNASGCNTIEEILGSVVDTGGGLKTGLKIRSLNIPSQIIAPR
jgi:hypothetical protein